MHSNAAGKMVGKQWQALAQRFPNIELHAYVVMPNHFHGIIEIMDSFPAAGENPTGASLVGASLVLAQPPTDQTTGKRATTRDRPDGNRSDGDGSDGDRPNKTVTKRKTLGDIVGAFQSITTVEYIRGVKNQQWPRFDGKLWQRNYWEHIIRNERSYHNISEYILNNPAKWDKDQLNGKG